MTCGSLAHAVAFGYHSPAMEPADTTRGSYPLERRTFIALVSGGLLAVPLAAEAQRTRPPRVGYLGVVPRPPDEAFKQGLRELGYVEGRNIIIEYRWGEGDGEAAVRFAREFVDLDVDVIVAVASRAARAAKQATSRVPIVMVDIADPIAFGFVTNLARPEGNITGFSAAATELSSKSLQLLKELVPSSTRVAVLSPRIPGTASGIQPAEAAAAAMGLRLERQEVPTSTDLPTAFAAIVQKRPDAMMVIADHFLYSHHPRIIEFAAKNRLPTVYGLPRVRTCWWLDGAGGEPRRHVSPRRRLCGQDPEGCQTRRSAGRATDEV